MGTPHVSLLNAILKAFQCFAVHKANITETGTTHPVWVPELQVTRNRQK